MFVDSHCHIFTNRIVRNVRDNPAMIEELKLNTHDALPRLEPKALEESAQANNVAACVLLPTAAPQKVRSENDRRGIGLGREGRLQQPAGVCAISCLET